VQRTLYEWRGDRYSIMHCYGIAMVGRSELTLTNMHKALRQLCDSKFKYGEQVKLAESINVKA
jgi:hypothetical protein